MKKGKIFIGCSSEALKLAEKAKALLEDEFDVVIWNESAFDSAVFRINNNFLDDLLKSSLQFDFGILIGTQDDKVQYRKKTVLQPRDNVLFELGLFIGRLGLSKCAFVIDKEIHLLSDIEGISLARFNSNKPKEFQAAIESVKEYFLNQDNLGLNFFPSATLASVYFENFIKPTCTHLINNEGFDYEGKKFDTCKIQIIIPRSLSSDLNLQFQKLKGKRKIKSAEFEYTGRIRTIQVDAEIEGDELILIDFPTILAGINYSIKYLLPQEFLEMDKRYHDILAREIDRFIKTVKKIALKENFDEYIEFIRE